MNLTNYIREHLGIENQVIDLFTKINPDALAILKQHYYVKQKHIANLLEIPQTKIYQLLKRIKGFNPNYSVVLGSEIHLKRIFIND